MYIEDYTKKSDPEFKSFLCNLFKNGNTFLIEKELVKTMKINFNFHLKR